MHKSLTSAVLLSALAAAAPKSAHLTSRDILTPLPENASDLERDYQPLVDFDTDSCYYTAAVDPDGNVNPGADPEGRPEAGCRDPQQLENSNTYARARCNNGICAIMYEYYFEKDQAAAGNFGVGHKHDWENVVVFVRDGAVIHTAVSCHGKYGGGDDAIIGGDTHPYVVYNKDGGFTHCFRQANQEDVDNPENFSGQFYTSPVVGWDGWPEGTREAVFAEWDGGVGPKIQDKSFADHLGKAAGDNVPDFDPNVDE